MPKGKKYTSSTQKGAKKAKNVNKTHFKVASKKNYKAKSA